MTTAPHKPRTARTAKTRAENLTPMAFQFDHLTEPVYTFTEVRWTREASDLIALLASSLKPQKKRLPIRDLRLRVQVRDRGVIGTDKDLGTRYGMQASRTLAFTTSEPEVAASQANDAVAEWAAQVSELAQIDEAAAKKLRKLALDQQATVPIPREEPVFGWETSRSNGTAKSPVNTRLFSTLADYVANLLTGQVIYPNTTPLRRIVSKDLTLNSAELMSDVMPLENKKGNSVYFCVGVTVSVETYPGRALPIVKIHHKKFVWSREPTTGKTKLSGYVLPQGETRALRFEVEKDLGLSEDYAVLATEYDLELPPKATTATLATKMHHGPHTVVITHKNGRSKGDVALYGVTDLDRRLSFERLAEVLQPAGFTPWAGLEEVPSPSKSQADADMAWKELFDDVDEEETEDEALLPSDREQEEAETKFTRWAERVKGNIDAHYGGRYHLILGFAGGLTGDAEKARDILERVLGDGATIELKLLPDNVHGTRTSLPGANTSKASERAAVRLKAWQPFITEVNDYMAEQPDNPVHGVLILAKKDNYPGRDDVINKRVARIALSRALGLTVQYLLPIRRKGNGEFVRNAEKNYRIRVVNAWRDLAWKSIGKMDGIERKAQEILGVPGRPVLGVGIIRVNRKQGQGNDASFIPYAIELDPVTGTCIGAVMLGNGEEKPTTTAFMPLPHLVHTLTDFGPSYLAKSKETMETNRLRGLYTQNFLQQVFVERTRLNPELIILADMATLGGMWRWLSDSEINPGNITLNDQRHAEQDYPNATFIRIRADIAPKVIMDTPQTKIVVDGEVRSSAKRSDADLYRVTDTASGMETYLSFGSRIAKSLANAASCYQTVTEANGRERGPHSSAWQTPNAIDITIVRPGTLEPEALAKFVEALRSEYAHFGSWINAPGPLHFASLLKAYVPDYELVEDDEDGEEEVGNMPLLPW